MAAPSRSVFPVNTDTYPGEATTMDARTVRLTGLTAVLALSVAPLAGCRGEAAQPGGASATAARTVSVADPRNALLKAVPDDAAGAYHFVIKGGTQPLSGVLDSAGKAATLDITQSEPD